MANKPTIYDVAARAAASILIHRTANPGSAPVAKELPGELAVRESCGCG